MEVVGDFFRALPGVFVEAWHFMDGLTGLLVILGTVLFAAVLAIAALRIRETHTWLSAIFGVMAASIAFWWAFGVIPSATTYFIDAERALLEGVIIPGSLPGFDNFYQVFRDLVVLGIYHVFAIAFFVGVLMIQKRFPRTLAEGEEKSPTSGGYR